MLSDAYLDPRFNQSLDKALKYRTRTILCVPVRDRRRNVVAVIQACNLMRLIYILVY